MCFDSFSWNWKTRLVSQSETLESSELMCFWNCHGVQLCSRWVFHLVFFISDSSSHNKMNFDKWLLNRCNPEMCGDILYICYLLTPSFLFFCLFFFFSLFEFHLVCVLALYLSKFILSELFSLRDPPGSHTFTQFGRCHETLWFCWFWQHFWSLLRPVMS